LLLAATVRSFAHHMPLGISDRNSFKARATRLAFFLRSNSRNLAFLKVVWHEKMVFGMYVIVWHFLAFSDGVGMKKHCLA